MPSARTTSRSGGNAGARGSWPPPCWWWSRSRAWSAGASTTPSQRAAASAAYSAALAKIGQDNAGRARRARASRPRARPSPIARWPRWPPPSCATSRTSRSPPLEAVAPSLPPELSDLALVIAGFRSVDTPASSTRWSAKLEPLARARPAVPRSASLELQALAAGAQGRPQAGAASCGPTITKDPAAPQGAAAARPGDAHPLRRRRGASRIMTNACCVSLPVLRPSCSRARRCRRLRLVRQEEDRRCRASASRSSPTAARSSPTRTRPTSQVMLPAPVVNDSWPQSGGFANYAMQHLAIGASPQVIWTADVGAGSSLVAHPDHAAGGGRRQGLRQGRREHRVGLRRRHRPA